MIEHRSGTRFWLDRPGEVVVGFDGTVMREAVRIKADSCTIRESVFRFAAPTMGSANAAGIWVPGRARGLTIDRVTVDGAATDKGTLYWQGDGFLAEGALTGAVIRHLTALRCADSGFDSKSAIDILDCFTAIECCASLKTFVDQRIGRMTSVNPVNRGGPARPRHLHISSEHRPVTVEIDHLTLIGDAGLLIEGRHPVTLIVHALDGARPAIRGDCKGEVTLAGALA